MSNQSVGQRIKLLHLVVGLGLIFWPIALFLNNTFSNFISYILPSFFLFSSWILLKRSSKLYFLPILFIPLIEPKLALLPFCFSLINLLWQQDKRISFVFLFLSLLVVFVTWKPFFGQTIFSPDYEARQFVIRKTHLYPTVFMARLFQNKARIYGDKFINNFFALSDPNNYFFAFHPRPIIIENQNLNKFPFIGLLFSLFGFFYLAKSQNKKFIIKSLVACLISLSLLINFDRHDFILWLPLGLIFVHGVQEFSQKFKKAKYVFWLFFVFAIPELIRIFFQ